MCYIRPNLNCGTKLVNSEQRIVNNGNCSLFTVRYSLLFWPDQHCGIETPSKIGYLIKTIKNVTIDLINIEGLRPARLVVYSFCREHSYNRPDQH